jgi:hypothetical protein
VCSSRARGADLDGGAAALIKVGARRIVCVASNGLCGHSQSELARASWRPAHRFRRSYPCRDSCDDHVVTCRAPDAICVTLALPFSWRWPTMPPPLGEASNARGRGGRRARGLRSQMIPIQLAPERTVGGRDWLVLPPGSSVGRAAFVPARSVPRERTSRVRQGGVSRWRAGSLIVCPSGESLP